MNVSFFERFKNEMQIGDITLYENDDITKEYLSERIRMAFAVGDLNSEQVRELYALMDYAIVNAKIRVEQNNIQNISKQKYANLPNFVSNPKSLDDRRARANYWRLNNQFQLVMDTINGKQHKFMKLWDEYNNTNDVVRKEEIVQIMEMMYPTTSKKLHIANEREGRSRK